MFQSVGLLRASVLFPGPIAFGRASVKPFSQTWHEYHDLEPSMLSRSSKNNCRPNATFSGVSGLSPGITIASYVVSCGGSGCMSGLKASVVGTVFLWQPTMNVTAPTSTLREINKSRNFGVVIESTRIQQWPSIRILVVLSADSYICVREMSRRNVYSPEQHVQFEKTVGPTGLCAGPCVFSLFRQRKRTHDSDDVCYTTAEPGFACGVETGETSAGQAGRSEAESRSA